MDTNVKLTAGHFDEMGKILMAKAGDIKTYEQTNNYSIQHLDVSNLPNETRDVRGPRPPQVYCLVTRGHSWSCHLNAR